MSGAFATASIALDIIAIGIETRPGRVAGLAIDLGLIALACGALAAVTGLAYRSTVPRFAGSPIWVSRLATFGWIAGCLAGVIALGAIFTGNLAMGFPV